MPLGRESGKLPGMADKDGDGPSLELPSLGFGRKRGRKRNRGDDEAAPAPAPAPESVTAPPPSPAPEPAPEPVTEPEPATAQMEAAPAPEREAPPAPAAEAPTERVPPVPEPAPAAPPLFADEVAAASTHAGARAEAPTRTDTAPVDEPVADEAAEEKPRREFRLPQIGDMPAALLTGAFVGLVLVGLTGAGFRLCEVVQGTSSCGDPGFLLLAAILVLVVVLGSTLLNAFSLPDPGSTSFLAVGLLAVAALLFLVDVLFNWWMIIVIPVLAMFCFALSHWVTTAFVETDE